VRARRLACGITIVYGVACGAARRGGVQMGGGMRRRVAGKKTEESELDTYKRLLKGDVTGFMEKQWTGRGTSLPCSARGAACGAGTAAPPRPFDGVGTHECPHGPPVS